MTTYCLVLEELQGLEKPTRRVFEITSQEYRDIEQFMDRFSGRPTQRRDYIHELADH
jgi:cell fate regulator YaaT (PSP1 superfamily)